MYVITAALSAPPPPPVSPDCDCNSPMGAEKGPFYCRYMLVDIYHGGGHVGNLCFFKVCWYFFGIDVVVIIQKGYHEAVKLKKYNAFNNNNLSYGKCL